MIPILFKRYKNAPLATILSFLSSGCYLIALLFPVGYLLNWEGLRDESGLGEILIVAAFLAVIGFGLMKLAERQAKRKLQRSAEKTCPTPTPTPTVENAPVSEGMFCPMCGAKVQAQARFCPRCGSKLR